MYRWYIVDECADGHWNVADDEWNQTRPDFSEAFPPTKTGLSTYVDRYRPGSNTLISKDSNGKPLKAILEITKGFASDDPALVDVDPEDTDWLTIPDGWRLLPDRLGIEVTAANPDQWSTGNPKLNDIRGILWSAVPTGDTNFTLRLTTVVDSDQRMHIVAKKRVASPTAFKRRRAADGKDHFQYCELAVGSLHYADGTQTDVDGAEADETNPLVMRDDTKAATTHAEQLRSAHEFPTLAGSATIPFITDYYGLADRVRIIQGRQASLQINVGIDQGETPSYPWITAFAWDFAGDRQQTVLQFSDRRAEPQGV
jgi:hypothetical protein